MDISSLLSAYPGTHIVQAFFHSLVAAVIVDRAVYAWDIRDPLLRQRFRLIVIVAPVVSYPLYQLIDPGRGSIDFRLSALFDSSRWLNLEIWGMIPVNVLFILFLATTSLVFLVQELIPILRHAAESKQSELEWDHPKEDSPVIEALGVLNEKPEVFITDDEELLIYSTTGNEPAVFVSTGLVNSLGPDELRAAIAHEAAHIRRSRRPLLILTYVLRVLQFFSPATLVEFRKVVEDEEKICDDEAAALTGKPEAMAGALRKIREASAEPEEAHGRSPAEMMRAIESMSHDMLLQRRIQRLNDRERRGDGGGWFSFAATLAAVLIINYFIV